MITMDEFLAYEKEHRLYELKYNDVYYWHIIRNSVCNDIRFAKLDKRQNKNTLEVKKKKKNWKEYLRHLPGQIKHFFDSKKYDIFVSYNYGNMIIQGKSINPYIDFLDEMNLKIKYHTIWSRNNWTREAPEKSNNTLIEVFWRLCYSNYVKLIGKWGKKDYENKLREIITNLNSKYGCNLAVEKYSKKVLYESYRFRLYKKYYRHIIKNKYQAVFIGYYQSTHNLALISAARECGIPVIEHQHGMISKAHAGYSFANAEKAGIYCPDYFFTFGDYWSEKCRLPGHTNVISVGSPQLDSSLSLYAGKEKKLNKVVYITDFSITNTIAKQAINFAKLAGPMGYDVTIKMHPKEHLSWHDKYPLLAEAVAGLDNLHCCDEPISVHELICDAQHVIGVISTVLFEALPFGCTVYSWDMGELKQDGFAIDIDLVDKGYIKKFSTVDELHMSMQNAETRDLTEFSRNLFKPDSILNIQNELKKIISGGKNGEN